MEYERILMEKALARLRGCALKNSRHGNQSGPPQKSLLVSHCYVAVQPAESRNENLGNRKVARKQGFVRVIERVIWGVACVRL